MKKQKIKKVIIVIVEKSSNKLNLIKKTQKKILTRAKVSSCILDT